MAVLPYQPASGSLGSVVINLTALCADSWEWDGSVPLIPAPSFCSAPYMQYVPGLKSLTLTVTGTWDLALNPFSAGIKLGSTDNTVVVYINTPIPYATASNVIVVEWDITDEADGSCKYKLVLSGNWQFNDFSNTLA